MGGAAAAQELLLIQWEVQSDQGTGQVLLLARAAHCLRRLAEARAGGAAAAAAAGAEAEELALVLALMRALLEGEPLLARRLAGVSIPYTASEATVDWLAVFTAGADLLPAAAEELSRAAAASAAAGAPDAAAARGAAARALAAAADCVAAAAALAAYQPARVVASLSRTRLLATADAGSGGALATPVAAGGDGQQQQQQQLVPVEALAGPAPAGLLDARLPELEALVARLEAPSGEYPVTEALLRLAAGLLAARAHGGPAPALVAFALRGVLSRLGELPFRAPAARWRLAALALRVVRLAVVSGAAGAGGAAPKAAGPPAGVEVTPLAAAVVQQLAFAGHGYLAAALPPPAPALAAAAEQRGGGGAGGDGDGSGADEALAAALEAALEMLALAPALLGATAHFPRDVPLQQFWLSVSAPTHAPCFCLPGKRVRGMADAITGTYINSNINTLTQNVRSRG